MLYLCFRLTPKRGWFRHLLCRQITGVSHFSAAVGQADFMRPRTKPGFAQKQNLPGRKRKQRYINSHPAAATAPSLVCFPLGFLTAFVDVILVLTSGTAKCSVGTAAQENFLAVLAQAQGLVIVHQHKAKHHLDTQQKGVEIPVDGGLIQQLNVIAGSDSAERSHGLAIQPPRVLINGVIIIVVQD